MWNGENCLSYTGGLIEGGCKHGYNFGDNLPDGMMVTTASGASYHGTQVASLIAAHHDND